MEHHDSWEVHPPSKWHTLTMNRTLAFHGGASSSWMAHLYPKWRICALDGASRSWTAHLCSKMFHSFPKCSITPFRRYVPLSHDPFLCHMIRSFVRWSVPFLDDMFICHMVYWTPSTQFITKYSTKLKCSMRIIQIRKSHLTISTLPWVPLNSTLNQESSTLEGT